MGVEMFQVARPVHVGHLHHILRMGGAARQHHDLIGQEDRLAQVMGDQDAR